MIFAISMSQIARSTGVNHHTQIMVSIFKWILKRFGYQPLALIGNGTTFRRWGLMGGS
jgi:hypothetical protein